MDKGIRIKVSPLYINKLNRGSEYVNKIITIKLIAMLLRAQLPSNL
jgi:hypothetical protein